MSLQLPPEHLTHLWRDAQLLVERTDTHRQEVEELVASADRELREAQTMASEATHADLTEVRNLLSGQVRRSASSAAKARHLSVTAREQHGAACRLLAGFERDHAVGLCRTKAVLVVDDYEDIRELISRVLQDAGFIVRTAANGLDAVIAAYEMRPRVIVMDVAMPVLDGIEATRLIKANDVTSDARVIAYTGNAPVDATLVGSLFSAVLHKPASPAAVLAAVQDLASL